MISAGDRPVPLVVVSLHRRPSRYPSSSSVQDVLLFSGAKEEDGAPGLYIYTSSLERVFGGTGNSLDWAAVIFFPFSCSFFFFFLLNNNNNAIAFTVQLPKLCQKKSTNNVQYMYSPSDYDYSAVTQDGRTDTI